MNKIKSTWIIDDDPIQVFIARKMMNNIDFTQNIRAFDNGLNALEELRNLTAAKDSNFPDVIFLDINMPQIDGWQFLKEFGKMSLNNTVAIYLVTSSIDPVDVQRGETSGSLSGYLNKPVKTEDLQKILKKYG